MKKMLVIGGSSGYGQGIARHMAALGWQVTTAQRTPTNEFGFMPLDLTSVDVGEQLDAIIATLREIDAIVIAAGIALDTRLLCAERQRNDIEKLLLTNVLGFTYACQLGKMLTPGGTLINIGSISQRANYVGGVEYCASKAYQQSLLNGLRLEFMPRGVRVTNIAVGMGDTGFHNTRFDGDSNMAKLVTQGVEMLTPNSLGALVEQVVSLPTNQRINELVFTPFDQPEHGYKKSSIN